RLQRIGNRQGVHRGREHSYMISSGSVHSAARSASPEVASANNDPYLNTGVIALFDTGANPVDSIKVHSEFIIPGKRLAAQLEENPLINRLHIDTLREFY